MTNIASIDIYKHNLAALRVVLPATLTQLSAFASLNKEYLKPYDTIHSIARAGDSFHGIVEITFALPTSSAPAGDLISVTGTDGWLSVNEVNKLGTKGTIIRTVIKSVVKVEGKPNEEKEEVIEEAQNGVVAEFASFFDAIQGRDELGVGDPFSALNDVAFVEAALNSNGELVDLTKLLQA
jgi:predicted dehydrogenase